PWRNRHSLAALRRIAAAVRVAPGAALRDVFGSARRYIQRSCFSRSVRRHHPAGTPPPVGSVNLGDLDRVAPISANFGFDRGTPIDRYYIERFLEREAGHIRGRVLEVRDSSYS